MIYRFTCNWKPSNGLINPAIPINKTFFKLKYCVYFTDIENAIHEH